VIAPRRWTDVLGLAGQASCSASRPRIEEARRLHPAGRALRPARPPTRSRLSDEFVSAARSWRNHGGRAQAEVRVRHTPRFVVPRLRRPLPRGATPTSLRPREWRNEIQAVRRPSTAIAPLRPLLGQGSAAGGSPVRLGPAPCLAYADLNTHCTGQPTPRRGFSPSFKWRTGQAVQGSILLPLLSG